MCALLEQWGSTHQSDVYVFRKMAYRHLANLNGSVRGGVTGPVWV